MTPASANEHLARARAGIEQALAQWDAADLPKVDDSCRLLSAAAADLRVFENAVRCGDVPATPELSATILTVKEDVARATRVVDSCAAFLRGLAARTGDAPPVYNAEGRIADEPPVLESELHA